MVERLPVKEWVVGSNPTTGAKYSMDYFVYVLYSQKDKNLYIGQTNKLEIRLNEHLNGRVKSTKNRRPLLLK